jgi:serine/threonine-protein kinase RsbW
MQFSEWLKSQLDSLRAMVGADGDDHQPQAVAATTAVHPSVQETRTPDKLELNFSSSTAHLSTVRRSIEQFSAEAGLAQQACEEIGLVVNEALANIIRHAYEGKKDQPVLATVDKIAGGVKISLRDWGNGVDPSTVPRPEHDPFVPGGLGLICMQRLMDEVHYEPQDDGMLLVMTRTAAGSKSRPDDKSDFP